MGGDFVVRGLFCRLLCAFFGLGVFFGMRRRAHGGHGCEGQEHHGPRLRMQMADPEKRRRFRRRLREAMDELLADEPEQPETPASQPML